ncbi:MAG: efflux RND transporter periplasmic adaptor subunit [Deltaproteobacteria bacterium]|nr:efflux RND transporter periplasmic adaptor subunit [Deltaproteobacteria bacterium]
MKKIIFILVAAGLISGAGILLKKRMQEVKDVPIPIPTAVSVKIILPKESSLRQTRPFLAQLTSVNIAHIATKLNGLITAVRVTENQRVKKGELLVQIDDRETLSAIKSLENDLKSLVADLKYTQKLHARNKAIFEVGGLAQEKLEASQVACAGKQAAVEGTRQKITAQQIQLGYLNIRAPFDGIVAAIFLRKGNLAIPGQPLLTLHSPEQKLTFSFVPDGPPLSPGQAVFLGKEKIGKVLKRYSDAKNGLFVAEVVLDQPLDRPDDSFLSIDVVVFDGKGCTVPVNALLHQKEGCRVMVYENGRFKAFPVIIPGQNRERALIDPCPSFPVAVGSEAKLSLLSTYGHVRIIQGETRD